MGVVEGVDRQIRRNEPHQVLVVIRVAEITIKCVFARFTFVGARRENDNVRVSPLKLQHILIRACDRIYLDGMGIIIIIMTDNPICVRTLWTCSRPVDADAVMLSEESVWP